MFTSMADTEIPNSVRVRTDDGNEWRYDAIQQAAALYECNRSDAVAYACEDVAQLVDALADILSREDLTLQQRRDIARVLDDTTSDLSIAVNSTVTVEIDG